MLLERYLKNLRELARHCLTNFHCLGRSISTWSRLKT